jgi:hypothetical protein
MGLKIPAWYLYEQFDVPPPEEEDEVLAPASPLLAPCLGGRGIGAAAFADPAGPDPREAAIDRAVARAPEAYRDLVAGLKKKSRPRSVSFSRT